MLLFCGVWCDWLALFTYFCFVLRGGCLLHPDHLVAAPMTSGTTLRGGLIGFGGNGGLNLPVLVVLSEDRINPLWRISVGLLVYSLGYVTFCTLLVDRLRFWEVTPTDNPRLTRDEVDCGEN